MFQRGISEFQKDNMLFCFTMHVQFISLLFYIENVSYFSFSVISFSYTQADLAASARMFCDADGNMIDEHLLLLRPGQVLLVPMNHLKQLFSFYILHDLQMSHV